MDNVLAIVKKILELDILPFIIFFTLLIIVNLLLKKSPKKCKFVSSRQLKKENNPFVQIIDLRNKEAKSKSFISGKIDMDFTDDFEVFEKITKMFPKKDTPIVIIGDNLPVFKNVYYLLECEEYTNIRILTDTKHLENSVFYK